jgi:MFS family permease
LNRKLLVFLILGAVSLFADMTYEGARSILGPYVEVLGASAIVAGALALGDFVGYVMRLVTGGIVGYFKSSRILWLFVIIGYMINLFSVPALAVVNSWQAVLALVILERTGKGIRTPARDVVLAEVSENLGVGKGFGLHELMDQIGAISGPLIVSLAISLKGYKFAFRILIIPAIIAISLIIMASLLYPKVRSVEAKESSVSKALSLRFILLLSGIAALSIGYLHWSIVSYYLKNSGAVSDYMIPMLYTIAMAVDAAVALPAGMLYDKFGLWTLIMAPLAAFPIPIALSVKTYESVIVASALWGIVMGLYETVMRASIADVVEPQNRAYAYGIYNFTYGVAWLGGSLLAGAIYDVSLSKIKLVMPAFTVLSLILILMALKREGS